MSTVIYQKKYQASGGLFGIKMQKILVCLVLSLLLSSYAVAESSIENISAEHECVQVFYDRSPDESYDLGRVYAMLLQNLLGHFPELQQIIAPIEYYQSGWLDRCRASIYIGSHFYTAIPEAFLADVQTTERQFAWLGYGLWNLSPEIQAQLFGFTYQGLTHLDQDDRDANGKPTFYKNIRYKGEYFNKFGDYDQDNPNFFHAAFEQSTLLPANDSNQAGTILATAHHNGANHEVLPYAVQKANRFYVADIPFSYMHESDRYLVFADLLFDILNLPPRHTQRKALLRIEDVHPKSELSSLYEFLTVLNEEAIPFHIAIIPIFFDPLYRYDRLPDEEFVPIQSEPLFVEFLEQVKRQHGKFIWHGVTHQYGRSPNPHTGYSSDDFEFWDAIHNRPIAGESVEAVLRRLDDGAYHLHTAGIFPKIWLTPHYQASPMDYLLFARVFPWNIGRVIYYLHEASGLPAINFNELSGLWYSATGNERSARRFTYFSDLQVEYRGNWHGQLFPYEIYGDYYGQRVLPEILGNPQPFVSSHVVRPRSVDDILADARRNLVLRDVWASMFFHPYLLNSGENDGIGEYPGDSRELQRLIRGIKEMGYQFIDAEDFVDQHQGIMRPAPIELD